MINLCSGKHPNRYGQEDDFITPREVRDRCESIAVAAAARVARAVYRMGDQEGEVGGKAGGTGKAKEGKKTEYGDTFLDTLIDSEWEGATPSTSTASTSSSTGEFNGSKSGSKCGSTPLHVAVYRCHIDCVRLLLEEGADVGALTEGGMTAAHIAACLGATDILYLLLTKGVRVCVWYLCAWMILLCECVGVNGCLYPRCIYTSIHDDSNLNCKLTNPLLSPSFPRPSFLSPPFFFHPSSLPLFLPLSFPLPQGGRPGGGDAAWGDTPSPRRLQRPSLRPQTPPPLRFLGRRRRGR